jgi:predicted glycosyltransferase
VKSFLFEINHPGHAHLFKHSIRYLIDQGCRVDVLAKPGKIIDSILTASGIAYIPQKPRAKSLAGKILKQFAYTSQAIRLQLKHKYKLGIGVSVTLPAAAVFSGLNTLVLDDDDKKATPLFAAIAHRFCEALLRPSCLAFEGVKSGTLYHQSLHELAYLHPDVFTPDPRILQKQGLTPGEPFFIVRLSALEAHHDIGKKGINRSMMEQLLEVLKPHGRVIVSSEKQGRDYAAEALKIEPCEIHHLMAYARLVVSDGQTMCSEAACLGVPSVRINDFAGKISYLGELEHTWGLTFGFRPSGFRHSLEKIAEILATPEHVFRERQQQLINNKINFNSFLLWFIENYPESKRIMKENPDYQYRFR